MLEPLLRAVRCLRDVSSPSLACEKRGSWKSRCNNPCFFVGDSSEGGGIDARVSARLSMFKKRLSSTALKLIADAMASMNTCTSFNVPMAWDKLFPEDASSALDLQSSRCCSSLVMTFFIFRGDSTLFCHLWLICSHSNSPNLSKVPTMSDT